MTVELNGRYFIVAFTEVYKNIKNVRYDVR